MKTETKKGIRIEKYPPAVGVLAAVIMFAGSAMTASAQTISKKDAIAATKDMTTTGTRASPDLVPISVTVVSPLSGADMQRGTNNTVLHRYRICAKNTGVQAASPPSDPGWWSFIVSYPDDKGGRPTAYYWSRHKVAQPVASGQTSCYEKDIWITYCRATPPRIRVSVDADKGIVERDENNNRKDFYPAAVCAGG